MGGEAGREEGEDCDLDDRLLFLLLATQQQNEVKRSSDTSEKNILVIVCAIKDEIN